MLPKLLIGPYISLPAPHCCKVHLNLVSWDFLGGVDKHLLAVLESFSLQAEAASTLELMDEYLVAELCAFWSQFHTVPVTVTVPSHPTVITTQGQGDRMDAVWKCPCRCPVKPEDKKSATP